MHDTWLFLSIATFVALGMPVGLLIGTRKDTAPLGAPTPETERLRRGRVNVQVRPHAKVAAVAIALIFVLCVCLTFATTGK